MPLDDRDDAREVLSRQEMDVGHTVAEMGFGEDIVSTGVGEDVPF